MKYVNRKTAILVALIVLVAVILLVFNGTGEDEETTEATGKVVEVARVSELSSPGTLALVGTVSSASEVVLRSETQGVITSIPVNEGVYLNRGQAIAYTENAEERARVAQAQAGVLAAEASLNRILSGATDEERAIAGFGTVGAQETLETARLAAFNAIQNAYSIADNAVRANIDPAFIHPTSVNPELRFSVPVIRAGNIEGEVEGKRREIQSLLQEFRALTETISPDENLESELNLVRSWLQELLTFSNDVSLALNNTASADSEITTWKANVNTARTSLTSALSTVTSAQSSLESARVGLNISEEQETQVTGEARTEDVQAARAQVAQAEANFALTQAALNKTIIRTPIGGTLNELFVEVGDLVGQFEEVGVVANNSALTVTTSVTPSEAERLALGTDALVDGRYRATVTSIAPAVSTRSRKVEVELTLLDSDAEVVTGQTVRTEITISRENVQNDVLTIPLSAVKVGIEGETVFTVDENNQLVAVPIVIAQISGGNVVVSEGIDPTFLIVTDARGLQVGETVVIE